MEHTEGELLDEEEENSRQLILPSKHDKSKGEHVATARKKSKVEIQQQRAYQ